jgi:hypothetical protein
MKNNLKFSYLALQDAIRTVQESKEGQQLNMMHQILIYADDINL